MSSLRLTWDHWLVSSSFIRFINFRENWCIIAYSLVIHERPLLRSFMKVRNKSGAKMDHKWTLPGLIFKYYVQFTTIKDVFNNFFNLVLVCKGIDLSYGKTSRRGFFWTVSSTFYYMYVVHKSFETFICKIFSVSIF